MSILASRGAELLEELHQKRIEVQEGVEKNVLQKLKFKMDKIKANQRKIQGPSYREPQIHKVGKDCLNETNYLLQGIRQSDDRQNEITSLPIPLNFPFHLNPDST